jgi:hypothetical protein
MLRLLEDLTANIAIRNPHIYIYEYRDHSNGDCKGILFNTTTGQALCLISSTPVKFNQLQLDVQDKYLLALSQAEKHHNVLKGVFSRKLLQQYFDENLHRFTQRQYKYVDDFMNSPLAFSELAYSEKVKILRECGYEVDGQMVIAYKAVTRDYKSMVGYPVYDEPFHTHGSSVDLCIWGKPIVSHKELLDKGKLITETTKYVVFEIPTITGYSADKFDDHCRGYWSASRNYVLKLSRPNRSGTTSDGYSRYIEVMYDINDPALTLNAVGHLRSLQMTVLHLNPKWRYMIDCVNKSLTIA